MSGSPRPDTQDRIDRFARGELTATEARELAQDSLDTPELFEQLTHSAVAKSGLTAESLARDRVVHFPKTARWIAAGATAAAALVVATVLLMRDASAPSRSAITPALWFAAKPGQPLLLASGLRQEAARAREVFRGVEPGTREPRQSGAITSIAAGAASIDLGSLDGIAKGSELPVVREDASAQPIGRLVVTKVFRYRAGGQIVSQEQIHAGNQVRIPGSLHIAALLEQVDALTSRGEADAARKMAERAAQVADVSGVDRQRAFERLAALEYQAGAYQAAEMHYRQAPDRGPALNNLAVLRTLRGDYAGAGAALKEAVARSPKSDAVYGRSTNNLAVLAELRGDRHAAETLYADALRALDGADTSAEERAAVEANLSRIRGSR
jgi:tetratricopeptide (TPR) repeat protein